MNAVIFAGLFVGIMTSILVPVYSDYLSPREQLESGVLPEDIQCRENRVLVIRDNSRIACVQESTADKMNWDVISTEFVQKIIPSKQEITQSDVMQSDVMQSDVIQSDVMQSDVKEIELQTVTLNVASPVEFEDDGREYDEVLQRRPSPNPIYDEIMRADLVIGNDDVSGTASFTSPPHEKYSINQGVGLYIEDWMPTHIPDGYRLLYADADYKAYKKTDHNTHWVSYDFVPNDFVLHQNVTDYTLLLETDGFRIGVSIDSVPHAEIEDSIEILRESRESQSGTYGGFREMTRDGKTVFAYAGGNDLNSYISGIVFDPDEYTTFKIHSNYLTLDELIPVFNSIMK